MKITYDNEADALYIKLKESEVHKTKEADENTILDYDRNGNLIGIEILFVKERMPSLLKSLKDVKVENIAAT